MTNILKKYYGISISLGLLFILFILMTVFSINKSTFAIDEETVNKIELVCPKKVTVGEDITCLINVNVSGMTILSVNANYKFDDDIKNVSFTNECNSDNCLETLTNAEHGFAVGNAKGMTENTQIGTIKFHPYDDVATDNSYDIGLTNIELCDSEYNIISIEDVTVNISIKDSIASLTNINVKYEDENGQFINIELDKKFDSEVYEYTASVSKEIDKIIIGYTKPEGATVTGPAGRDVSLHYGTNNFDLVVVSEDEKNTVTYQISVFREYEFSTETYKYNKDNNYIYTAGDSKEEILNNLETLDNNLSYNITEENKLEIKYGSTEVLSSIDIIGFNSEYDIIDNVIYIGSNLTYQEIIDKIVSDSVDIKVLDSKGNEINKGTLIDKSHKLMVYYNNNSLLDSYTFNVEHLEIDNSLIIDNTNKIIKRIPIGIKYNEFKDLLDTNGEITILSGETEITDMNGVVKTGDKISIKLINETITYTLSVLGDLTGDGEIKINDVDRLYRGLKGRRELSNIEISSGDIINNGSIKVNDVDKLYRYLKGRITSLEAVE